MSDIFRAYDIRGKYPGEINKKAACLIGQAFVDFLKEKTRAKRPLSVVGRDKRASSTPLFKSLARGLKSQKAKVISIGEVPTDAFYFAFKYFKAGGGIMITASHNPSKWNGFKMIVKSHGFVCQGQGMEKLKSKIRKAPTGSRQRRQQKSETHIKDAKIESKNIIPSYLNHILKMAKKLEIQGVPKLFKIGVEFLGGVAFKVIKPLVKKFSLKTVCLNSSTHSFDPLLPKNLRELSKVIRNKKLDFGIAFDGDGDRIIFLDEKGKLVDPSSILALLSLYFMEEWPHSKIVYNLVCSKVVREEIKSHGGVPIRTRVGHVFIKKIAEKKKAAFGGEHSGHYFFKENGYSECSALVLLLMLKILSDKKKRLSELIEPLKRYFKGGEINLPLHQDAEKIYKKITSHFKGGKIDYLDGLTIEFKDWWFNLRESQTEPLFKLTIEAKNKRAFLEKKKAIFSILFSL